MVSAGMSEDGAASLAEVLAARAVATPMSRLMIDLGGGAAVAIVALWARPFAWFALAAAGACLSSYGLWAAAEKRLEAASPLSLRWEFALETAQRVAAPLGVAAFVGVLFGLLGVAFGRVIS